MCVCLGLLSAQNLLVRYYVERERIKRQLAMMSKLPKIRRYTSFDIQCENLWLSDMLELLLSDIVTHTMTDI